MHSINDLLKCVQQLRMNDAFFKVMIPGCVPFLVNNTARFALGEELLTPIQSLLGSKALTQRDGRLAIPRSRNGNQAPA